MVRVLAADRTAESSNDTNFAFSPDRPSRCLVIALAAAGRGLCCERFFSELFAGSAGTVMTAAFTGPQHEAVATSFLAPSYSARERQRELSSSTTRSPSDPHDSHIDNTQYT
jgi:hypothetical protein